MNSPIHQVRRLTDCHDALVLSTDSAPAQRYWEYWQSVTTDDSIEVFGVTVENRVISFCIAPVVPQNSPFGEIIWIYTDLAYRRRGFGRSALPAATDFIVKHQAFAFYTTETQNTASIATAKSVGYLECQSQYAFRCEIT